MKIKRLKLTGIILALVMLVASLGMLITTAFEADGEDTVASITAGTTYATVSDTITAASAGDTVTLLANTTESITVDKDLTLDLNGKQLSGSVLVTSGTVSIISGAEDGQIYSESETYALRVEGGTVSIGENVTVECASEDATASVNVYEATLTVDGGTVRCDYGHAVYAIQSTVTLNSGVIECTDPEYQAIYAYSQEGSHSYVNLIDGVVVSAGYGVAVCRNTDAKVVGTWINNTPTLCISGAIPIAAPST